MTNYENDILARLLKGENPDVIAKEMTDQLNKAIAAKKEQDQKNAELRKAEEAKRAKEEQLDHVAATILADLHTYLKLASPELAAMTGDISVKEMRELMDSLIEYFGALSELANIFDVKPKAKPASNSADDVLKTWIRNL